MKEMERKIIDAVEEQREDLIQFFKELVMIPSFNKHEQAVAAHLMEGLKRRGMKDVQILGPAPDRPNVVAYLHGTEDGPTFTFNGHLDVLAVQNEDAWKHPPFGGEIEDGKLYGRGTVDMKGGTFSSFFAGLVLEKMGLPIRGKVCFTGVCDELISGDQGVIYLIRSGVIRKEHPDDIGLNCEPTDLKEMNISTKGVLRADVKIIGKGAFNARPYLGINAIDKAVKFIEEIQKLNYKIGHDVNHVHPMLEPRTVCVATIRGGEQANMVPDSVTMTVTRRLHPGEDKDECLKDYQDIIDRLHAEDPEFVAEVHPWKGFRPPADVPADTPLIGAVARAQKLICGTEMGIVGSEGGTDGSHVVAMTGIPMPVYGPGNYKLLGTEEEYIALDQFIDAVKIYALTIYYMLGIDEGGKING